MSVKVGIAQYGSVHLDLEASLEKLEKLVKEASTQKVQMLVFGETWLSGYPVWLDYCPNVALWDHGPTKEVYMQFRKSAITVPGEETQFISDLAKSYNMVITIGINEKIESGKGNGTIYNSLLTFNNDGTLLNHHRKLVPTFTEKLLHGQGDAQGLKAVETGVGRVGGLICWEHYMPLSRQALHNSGEHIHVAVWPNVHERLQVASRHYAFEGRCFVLAAGQVVKAKEIPQVFDLPEDLANDPEKYVLKGGSSIIGPDGNYIVEPVWEQEAIVTAEIDVDSVYAERMTLDTSGHYQRHDVFNFEVNHERQF
ncbi:MAG: carbon-nitrogen hydrolase family protein [Bacteroidota bacterium]